jgi:hypothetical protein
MYLPVLAELGLHHQAYTGLDGFMLAKLTAGMSPQPAPLEAVTELLLMPLFRAVALVYLKVFMFRSRRG